MSNLHKYLTMIRSQGAMHFFNQHRVDGAVPCLSSGVDGPCVRSYVRIKVFLIFYEIWFLYKKEV
jgi:hypothetical protein